MTSCEKPDIIVDSSILKTLYDNSHDTLIIDNSKYFLETDLSRNLMPGGPIPTKRRLVALIFLVNADSLPVSSNIMINRLYIINDQLIWTSIPNDSNQPHVPDYKLDKVSIDGPQWETDIYVDVVVEIKNASTGDKYLLIARQQLIQKLE